MANHLFWANNGNAFVRIVFLYNPYEEDYFWGMTTGKGWPLEPHNEGWF